MLAVKIFTGIFSQDIGYYSLENEINDFLRAIGDVEIVAVTQTELPVVGGQPDITAVTYIVMYRG